VWVGAPIPGGVASNAKLGGCHVSIWLIVTLDLKALSTSMLGHFTFYSFIYFYWLKASRTSPIRITHVNLQCKRFFFNRIEFVPFRLLKKLHNFRMKWTHIRCKVSRAWRRGNQERVSSTRYLWSRPQGKQAQRRKKWHRSNLNQWSRINSSYLSMWSV
jgi:hypothetical protein